MLRGRPGRRGEACLALVGVERGMQVGGQQACRTGSVVAAWLVDEELVDEE
jgi:hypothetical protein